MADVQGNIGCLRLSKKVSAAFASKSDKEPLSGGMGAA